MLREKGLSIDAEGHHRESEEVFLLDWFAIFHYLFVVCVDAAVAPFHDLYHVKVGGCEVLSVEGTEVEADCYVDAPVDFFVYDCCAYELGFGVAAYSKFCYALFFAGVYVQESAESLCAIAFCFCVYYFPVFECEGQVFD